MALRKPLIPLYQMAGTSSHMGLTKHTNAQYTAKNPLTQQITQNTPTTPTHHDLVVISTIVNSRYLTTNIHET